MLHLFQYFLLDVGEFEKFECHRRLFWVMATADASPAAVDNFSTRPSRTLAARTAVVLSNFALRGYSEVRHIFPLRLMFFVCSYPPLLYTHRGKKQPQPQKMAGVMIKRDGVHTLAPREQ